MPRSRLAVLLLLAIRASGPASATTPEPSEDDVMRSRNREMVAAALQICSTEATHNGTYEIIEVEFAYDTGRSFVPTFRSMRPGLGRRAHWCIEHALADLRVPPLPNERYREAKLYAVGEIPSFPKELLPAWQRAAPDPDRIRRALGAWLPPEVQVTPAGCLHLAGPLLLAKPFREWRVLRKEARPFFLVNGDQLYALAGDWWLRRHQRTLEDGEMVDEEYCLDHVDPALSRLRRTDTWLHDAADAVATFEAEWVVDGQGRLAGDVGLCLLPPPADRHLDLQADQAEKIRRQVEDLLGRLDYGPGAGLRGVRIRYDSAAGLVLGVVEPAARPLDRRASTVEARCDVRKVLRCARRAEAARATLASLAPLRTCLRETGANDHFISVMFDISSDGGVTNARTGPTYATDHLPIPDCIRQAIAGLSFPRSDGGSCFVMRPLNEILSPPAGSSN